MNPFWSDVVHQLTPYVPGEQPRLPDLIKLNTNENPYGPSPRALEALRAEVADTLRLYPDPASVSLRRAIADHNGVAVEEVFVGNGSDEVLAHAFRALLKRPAPILFPDVTYSFYPVYCRLFGIDYREVPVSDAFEVDVDDYRPPNGGIILPNPNAPSGRLLSLDRIDRLLASNPQSPVVIDEAYIDFGGETAVPLASRYPNLLVTRTLSKSHSLAGLRVGYAVGDRGLIEALNRVKDSFNSYPVDRLAEVGAAAAIADKAYWKDVCHRVIHSRERTAAALTRIGFEVIPSAANFLFVRFPGRDAAELTARLRERGILVRHFAKPARVAPYMRITIGTDAQCDALVLALRTILG